MHTTDIDALSSHTSQEALRLFETLTGAQGEHALPHVPRMVSAIARRFKDPDSNVADACVDAMGSLAAFAVGCRPGGSRLVLGGDGDGQGKPVAAGPEALGRGVASYVSPSPCVSSHLGNVFVSSCLRDASCPPRRRPFCILSTSARVPH